MKFIKWILILSGFLWVACSENKDEPLVEVTTPSTTAKVLESQMSYNADMDGSYNVYLANLDGTSTIQLTNDTTFDNWWPRISPDREQILFYRAPESANQDYGQASLWRMDAAGANKTELLAPGANGWTLQAHAEWSPDGTRLLMCAAISGVLHIATTDASGGNPQQLTTDGTWNCDPSWSPAGDKIVFNRCTTVDCGGAKNPDLEIYEMDSDGSNLVRRTNDALADYDPYYSQDSQKVAWLKLVDPAALGGVGSWGIYAMNPDGGSQSSIIDDGFVSSKPAWSANGSSILFHRIDGTTASKWQIFSIHPDGSALTKINIESTANFEYPTN